MRERATEQLRNLAPTPPTPLELDLRRVTDSELMSSPDDALRSIARATADADNRNTIMTHVRQCLSEEKGKNWRRVYGGLAIVEELLQADADGVRKLFAETGEGRHFDLNFRLTFLENFEYDLDLRVQGLVRQRAASLRPKLLKLMETETARDGLEVVALAASTGSVDLLGEDEPASGLLAAPSVQPGDLDLLGFDAAQATVAEPELSLLMDFEPSCGWTVPEMKKVGGSDSEGVVSTDSTAATGPAPILDLLDF